jgi:phenylpyruvate tautomerase PptA (4-oxalocrotonate tautomerase family)
MLPSLHNKTCFDYVPSQMLFSTALLSVRPFLPWRSIMPQLNLLFAEPPAPETPQWEKLDPQQKQTIVEKLSRLLVKAIQPEKPKETPTHE